jgi:hypothetical protein
MSPHPLLIKKRQSKRSSAAFGPCPAAVPFSFWAQNAADTLFVPSDTQHLLLLFPSPDQAAPDPPYAAVSVAGRFR